MIKYDVILVLVEWTFNDLTTIKTYTDLGWRFIGYSPDGKYVYFDRKWISNKD